MTRLSKQSETDAVRPPRTDEPAPDDDVRRTDVGVLRYAVESRRPSALARGFVWWMYVSLCLFFPLGLLGPARACVPVFIDQWVARDPGFLLPIAMVLAFLHSCALLPCVLFISLPRMEWRADAKIVLGVLGHVVTMLMLVGSAMYLTDIYIKIH
jgi:hypothetical protein